MRAVSGRYSLRCVCASSAGCGRAVETSDVKLVGVGNNPDEIGPAPTPYGGLVEYNHVDFSGGALPLGAMGLSSYTEAGPSILNMEPPYGAVFGLSYIFDAKLRGTTSRPLILKGRSPRLIFSSIVQTVPCVCLSASVGRASLSIFV